MYGMCYICMQVFMCMIHVEYRRTHATDCVWKSEETLGVDAHPPISFETGSLCCQELCMPDHLAFHWLRIPQLPIPLQRVLGLQMNITCLNLHMLGGVILRSLFFHSKHFPHSDILSAYLSINTLVLAQATLCIYFYMQLNMLIIDKR